MLFLFRFSCPWPQNHGFAWYVAIGLYDEPTQCIKWIFKKKTSWLLQPNAIHSFQRATCFHSSANILAIPWNRPEFSKKITIFNSLITLAQEIECGSRIYSKSMQSILITPHHIRNLPQPIMCEIKIIENTIKWHYLCVFFIIQLVIIW